MDELQNLWQAHLDNAPYPPEAHIEGFELELYDANIAAVAIGYLKRGDFKDFSIIVIKENVGNLREVIPRLPASTQTYFKTLLALGEKLLDLWE